MTNRNDHNEINELINKLLNGTLTGVEKAHLRALSENNEFLRDALDGFESFSPETSRENIRILRQYITRRRNAYPLLKLAAALILMVVATVLTINLLPGSDSSKEVTSEVNNALGDTTSQTVEGNRAETPEDIDETGDTRELEDNTDEFVAQDIPAVSEPGTPNVNPAESDVSGTQIRESTPEENSAPVEESSEVILDEVPAEENISESTEDLTGQGASDDTKDREEAAGAIDEGYTDQDQTELEEQKLKSRETRTLSAPVEAERLTEESVEISTTPPQPENGWEAFNQYIREEIQYPDSAQSNDISGEVVVRFFVNSDGSLGDFTIQSSLGYGCDEEAIRLIREGPAWKPAQSGQEAIQQQTEVSIQFP